MGRREKPPAFTQGARLKRLGVFTVYLLVPIGLALILVGLVMIAGAYLMQRRGFSDPRIFFAFHNLPVRARRVWLTGYWLIVASYLTCMLVGWLYSP